MRWSTILAWDGVLPLAIAAITTCVRLACGNNHIASMTVAVMSPVAAALLRAAGGATHLARTGPPKLARSVAFVAAVAVLFAAEMLGNLFQLSPKLPIEVYGLVAALYLLYFSLIVLAFRPWPMTMLVRARTAK